MDSIQLKNRLNRYSHKELHNLVIEITGKPLGFDPFRKGYATGGKKKEDCIKWIATVHPAKMLEYFDNLDGKKTETDPTETDPTETETETKPEIKKDSPVKNKKAVDFSNLQKVFEEIFEQNSQSVDREEVKGIVESLIKPAVKEAVSNIQPQMIVIDKVKKTEYKSEGAVNKIVFERCLKLANQPENSNGMLVGPAGSGKTHIVGQIAKAMGRNFTTLSVTAGISESHLTGWLLPVGDDGRFIHLDAPFLEAYENGNSIILLDEMDSADPNVLLCINQALANGGFTVAQRHEKAYVKRGENVTIFGACNTFGNGADHRYVGREQLDLSTLDRFDIIEMDYDKTMERALCGANHAVLEFAENVRKVISRNSLDRIFSTRKVLNYYKKIEGGQYTLDECKEFYFAGWSKDDKALVA